MGPRMFENSQLMTDFLHGHSLVNSSEEDQDSSEEDQDSSEEDQDQLQKLEKKKRNLKMNFWNLKKPPNPVNSFLVTRTPGHETILFRFC